MGKQFNRDVNLAGGARLMKGATVLIDASGNVKANIQDALASGKIYVGNASGVSAEVAVSGDATLANTGALTVADGAITPAKLSASGTATATADGLTTGLISGSAQHVVVTSDSATKLITLPASSAALIGKTITLWVGANGFELVTPATSNATINGTDADGTNQADIPADSLSRLTLVATDTWILENIGSNGTVAAAIVPDND